MSQRPVVRETSTTPRIYTDGVKHVPRIKPSLKSPQNDQQRIQRPQLGRNARSGSSCLAICSKCSKNCIGIQILLSSLLVQGQTTVHAYFLSDTWYSLQPETYGQKMFSGFNDVNAPLSSLTPVFVRGGFILPRQAANTTTTASRLNPFEVLITVKTNAASSGELYYDNGDDIIPNDNVEQHPRVHWQFSFTSSIVGGVFTGNCETCSTTVKPPTLDTIEILGYPSAPNFSGFKLDGSSMTLDMSKTSYDASTQRVMISSKNLIS
ncbi:hypothetical protein B9Z55_015278 [Caenorhabditis nigoni]|uniref:Glycosyl hydrolase family 31 C-terminal domain-containing protein n=1 Tax=Caenorhabditis nigoni TaxID=1611254 RepID=A0A2G5U9I0_9PELO|nr:hypothetical protein B9Z55_015278 [Caenorhabditis nigoni]